MAVTTPRTTVAASAAPAGFGRRVRGLLPVGMLPLSVYLLALLVAPTALLFVYSFWESSFFTVVREFTLDNYRTVFSEPLYRDLILRSMGVGLAVAAIVVVCGFVLAYAITFRLGKWGPRILALVMASMLASYVVRIYAWKTVLGTNGLLNQGLMEIGLISEPLTFLLYGYFAIIVTLVYVYLPLAVPPIYAGLQDIDRRALEAARDLGASPWRVFRDITLPLAAPAMRTAFTLAFILAATDYVTPNLVGGVDGQMIGALIQNQFAALGNYTLGAALATSFIGATVVMLLVVKLAGAGLGQIRRRVPARRRTPRLGDPSPLARAVAKVPFLGIATGALLLFLLVPLITLLVFSFNDSRVPGIPFQGFTTHWYGDLMSNPDFHRVLQTSVAIAVGAVAGALLIGVPAAFALARGKVRARGLYESAVYGPIAIPGVVIGVALLTTFNFASVRLGAWPTAAVHVMLVVPFVILIVRARLVTMNPRIEEAARDLGAGRGRVLRTISLPLLLPSLLGAVILCLATSLDQLVVTNFTIGADATVPTWIYGQMKSGLTPAINAAAVFMLVVPLALIGLVALWMRWRSSRNLASTMLEAR